MDIHDFRMTDGINNINLIFDVEVLSDVSDIDGLKTEILNRLKERDSRLNAVITVDYRYD